MIVFWFLSFIAFLLIRRYYGGFFGIYWAISAFFTTLLSIFYTYFLIQFLFFIFFTLTLAPLLYKKLTFLHPLKPAKQLTFTELIGECVTVTEAISSSSISPGYIRLDQEIWPAFSTSTGTLPKNSKVFVHKIEGLVVFVSPTPPAQPQK